VSAKDCPLVGLQGASEQLIEAVGALFGRTTVTVFSPVSSAVVGSTYTTFAETVFEPTLENEPDAVLSGAIWMGLTFPSKVNS